MNEAYLLEFAKRLQDAVLLSCDKDLGPLAMEAAGALQAIAQHHWCGCCPLPPLSITVAEAPCPDSCCPP